MKNIEIGTDVYVGDTPLMGRVMDIIQEPSRQSHLSDVILGGVVRYRVLPYSSGYLRRRAHPSGVEGEVWWEAGKPLWFGRHELSVWGGTTEELYAYLRDQANSEIEKFRNRRNESLDGGGE